MVQSAEMEHFFELIVHDFFNSDWHFFAMVLFCLSRSCGVARKLFPQNNTIMQPTQRDLF